MSYIRLEEDVTRGISKIGVRFPRSGEFIPLQEGIDFRRVNEVELLRFKVVYPPGIDQEKAGKLLERAREEALRAYANGRANAACFAKREAAVTRYSEDKPGTIYQEIFSAVSLAEIISQPIIDRYFKEQSELNPKTTLQTT